MKSFLLAGLMAIGLALQAQKDGITALVIDDAQNIYLGSSTGLSKMHAETRQVTRILGNVRVSALAWSKRHGVFAAGNGNEIWTADGSLFTTVGDAQTSIRSMIVSGANIWAGTNQGVYVVSLNRQTVTAHHTIANSPMASNTVTTMYVDGSGIKWIGTDNGVLRVEGEKKWRLYEQGARFTAITGNAEGVWLASDKEMWLVDPYNRWTPTGVTEGLSSGEIRALASDRKGRIYLLSNIFVQFDPYTDIIIPVSQEIVADAAQSFALLIDDSDQLWLASSQDQLTLIDPELEISNAPFFVSLIVTHPACAGSPDGALQVKIQGGRPPYQVTWGDAALSGSQLSGLAPGTYEVTVTDQGSNSFVDVAQLSAPDPMQVFIQQDASVEGLTLVANGRGGRGDYTYRWSDGSTARRLGVSSPGAYSVTVTDVNRCMVTAAYTVDESVFAKPAQDVPEVVAETQPLESVTVENLKVLDVSKLNVGQVLRIEQLQFQADSARIQPESYAVLDGIYAFLLENDRIVIEVGGHTNGLPEHDYCDRLSTARAKSVAEYIYSKGIPTERIIYYGYGKRVPIATNQTVEGRRKNQRVEVKILQM